MDDTKQNDVARTLIDLAEQESKLDDEIKKLTDKKTVHYHPSVYSRDRRQKAGSRR